VAARLAEHLGEEDLTARELEVLRLIQDGYKNKQIADKIVDFGKYCQLPHQKLSGHLTLSKHLWHKDLNTTLRCYGAKFDTSLAACQVDEWFERREQTSGYAGPAATSLLVGRTVEAIRPSF
jgi:hypothetical protein